jgi:predicted SprT family Zn-dependent metalloprotease
MSNKTHQTDDYLLALQIQIELNETDDAEYDRRAESKLDSMAISLTKTENPTENLVNPSYDLIDPCPDIRALFQEFDKKYFYSRLGSCIVEWSKRMTICAGIFYLREGGIIRLSEPLLKLRPRHDLIQTLLHEMIHAYLYLTRNFRDRDGHGDEFKSHMNRINKLAGTKITIYHSFHDEVNYQRQHVWRCDGVCRTMKPFFGYVKRSMNRAPGPNDLWWANHKSTCSGKFEKVSEPESFAAKKENSKRKSDEKGDEKTTKTHMKKKIKSDQTELIGKIDGFMVPKKPTGILTTQTDSIKNKTTESTLAISSTPSTSSKLVQPSIKSYISPDKATQTTTTESIRESRLLMFAKSSLTPPKLSQFAKKANKMSPSSSSQQKLTSYFPKSPPAIPTLPKQADIPDANPFRVTSKVKEEIIFVEEIKTDDDIYILDKKKSSAMKPMDLVECPLCFKTFDKQHIDNHVNEHFL